jgi:protein gp37
MTENSKIEWTDHTFNPWIGCQKVSPGCDHCYAERDQDHRFHLVEWGPHGERKRTTPDYWRKPFRWAKHANGSRPRVFCASLADWLDNQVSQQWRSDLADVIARTPELDWLMLTKRIELFDRLAPWPRDAVPANVWIGTTAENQEWFDRRWAYLRTIKAPVRFLSCEPMLTPIDIKDARPDWIICGGESGPGARMMDPAWARSLRDQCAAAGISFFMKQMTGKKPIPAYLMTREWPRSERMMTL